MLLSELFEGHYRPLRLRGRSQNTSRLYGCTLRTFSRWLGYPATIDDLSDLMLSRFLEARAATRSPYTAEKERTQLCALWRFAADRGIVSTRPEVPPAPLPERVPTAWSVEELHRLLAAAAATRGSIGSKPAGVWFCALVSVLWETAERIGAVMACSPDDLTPPHLVVRAEYRKGKRRDRVYRLTPETCRLAHIARGRNSLFEWPYCPTSLWSKYKDIVARAGLGRGRHLSFHQLRRSAASHYAARGGDATSLLDHENPRTTRRWYLDRRLTETGPAPCDVLPRITPPEREAP